MTIEPRILNSEQQKAVEFGDGPLLIIAGAGTGKTTVVTERIKHIISEGRAKPSEILALTFTEKAAREMEERVDVIMPYGYTQMWISTFHKFCDRILRLEAIHIGLNPSYVLMTDTDATMLFRRHLFDFHLDYFRPLGNPTKFIAGILQHFSRLQDEDVNPTQYLDWVKKQKSKNIKQSEEEELEYKKYKELATAYQTYQDIKVQEGYMDFGDLICQTLHLFRTRKNILASYQKQFHYILVDEFQDTNIAQNELVSLLAGQNQNITAVCDDDQSIYKFRGAAVSNVLSFRKHFPASKLIVLLKNYRSTQAILDASYQLIQHNNPDRLEIKEQINKKLISEQHRDGVWPKFLYVDRVENEADIVAKEILEQHKLYDWKDIAILVRANSHAEPFMRAFDRQGIPYQFLGPGQLFRQPEIKELIAYLAVLQNFENDSALYRVLSMEYFGISPRDIAALANIAKKQNTSLFEACEKSEIDTIVNIVTLVHKHLGLVTRESAGQLLYFFLAESGMIKNILDYKAPLDEMKARNISKFFSKLKSYEIDHADASVSAVLDWLELSAEIGESPLSADSDWMQNNAVNILTVHGAKGLEFPIVFLVNMVGARFPTTARREQIPIPDELIKEELPEGDYHLEEERRLFYVGMTRARDLLYMSAANFYGEGKREKKVSPFIYEVVGDAPLVQATSNNIQIPLLEWKSQSTKEVGNEKHDIGPVTYLSYSQIETFRLCPLHYKLKYLLHIPNEQSASLSFGISIHNAMRDFYQLHANGNKVTKKMLLNLLATHWVHAGYENKKYEAEMKKRGEKYISDYFTKQFDKKTQIIALEQPFIVPLDTEEHGLKIGGKIDRMDVLPDGTVEIIDYKTGRMPSKREVDTNLQLSMYALAACEIPGAPFGRLPENIKLTLYFFDTNERISTYRTKDQLEAAKEAIRAVARDIETSDFQCSHNILCHSCEYTLFCDAR